MPSIDHTLDKNLVDAERHPRVNSDFFFLGMSQQNLIYRLFDIVANTIIIANVNIIAKQFIGTMTRHTNAKHTENLLQRKKEKSEDV